MEKSEQALIAEAAVGEMNAIGQILTQRCVNHATEKAVLKVTVDALQKEIEALKAKPA